MTKTPTVAIWVISKDHENYLEQCIESIVTQETSFPFQVYLGVDKSEDKTALVAKQLAAKYSHKISLYLSDSLAGIKGKEGIGVVNYRRCISSGAKYIALCEGDDYWISNNKLQQQFEILEKNKKLSAVGHQTMIIDEFGNEDSKKYGENIPNDLTTKDLFSKRSLIHTSSLFFRAKLLELPEWFYNTHSGDMALYSIISRGGDIRVIQKTMSVYRKHKTGITSLPGIVENHHFDRIQLMRHLNEYHQYEYDYEARQVIKFHQSKIDEVRENTRYDLFYWLKNIIKRILGKG